MDANEFTRIVTSFADNPADILLNKGRLFMQVREEVIEAELTMQGGNVIVTETGSIPLPATSWIVDRLARVHQLADRVLSYVEPTNHYVKPRGVFLDDVNGADAEARLVHDAGEEVLSVLSRRPAGTANVLYLTSDAGEGKTTLINEVARVQAARYKKRETDWLLIPISLGGRPFMRFDDVVIGALVNRLRFPFFYYDAFVELVRMGVLVPAFDGFEEVFIEGASGEALSALGGLVSTLNSSGSMLISARKAYFEYREFGQTSRLFDAIGGGSVSFSRLALERWSKTEVTTYAELRQIKDSDIIYDRVAARLLPDHPLLTRAVLVRRLFDVATSAADTDVLLEKLGTTSRDYFVEFVSAIIEREANEKWTDRSGKVAQPLLEVAEHHELLSMIAMEMWLAGTESLRHDVVEVIADVFAEHRHKTPIIARQIKERLNQHALLTSSEGVAGLYSFDHEDFRKFFLGQAIANAFRGGSRVELQSALRRGALPEETCESAAEIARRFDIDRRSVSNELAKLALADPTTSFTRENVGALVLRLLSDTVADDDVTLDGLTFAVDALAGVDIARVLFINCFFQSSSLERTRMQGCKFRRCRFEALDLFASTTVTLVVLDGCDVGAVAVGEQGSRVFDPAGKIRHLQKFGFQVEASVAPAAGPNEPDERSILVERAFRLFLRNTQVNENTFRVRLGVKGPHFVDDLLPVLVKNRIVDEMQSRGSGSQRRFRLAIPMRRVEESLRTSAGDFDNFVRNLSV